MDIVQEFLSEYKNSKTKKLVQIRLQHFLKWSKKTPEQLSKLDSKTARHMLLKFQSEQRGKMKDNTLLSYISAAKNFFQFNDITIKSLKGKLVRPQKAEGYHVFSNGDLGKMFEVANVQYKTLLAVATSTGWSLDDILRLDKQQVTSLIQRAKQEGKTFIYFKSIRRKTYADSLCVLNPLAIEWLSKWVKLHKGKSLFNIKGKAIFPMLKKIVERSGIITTGEVRFHNIRKWCISSLSKAGFNEFQIKYIVGKSIPLSDLTYLQGIEEQIEEKYSKVYDQYLSILRTTKIVKGKDEEIANLEEQVNTLRGLLISILGGREKLERIISKTMKPQDVSEDSMFPFKRPTLKMPDEELVSLYFKLLKKSGRA